MGSQRPLKVKQVTVNPPALKPSGEPGLGLARGFAQKMVFNAIFCSELFRMRLGPKVSAGLIPDVDRGCCGPAAKVLLPLCPFILLGLVRWDFCSPGRRRLESKGPGRYSVAVRRHRWL